MPSEEVVKGEAAPKEKKTATAVRLASKQQEISVTEFFEKNKQILGFDSRSKSLLMGIKEAVDNSLDACEEAGFLPDVDVSIERLNDEDYRIRIEDNGPGIVHKMMPNVFGRLLYGSRFHALRQSRGQQGIGISATVMYGNITTGKPAHVMSKIEGDDEVLLSDVASRYATAAGGTPATKETARLVHRTAYQMAVTYSLINAYTELYPENSIIVEGIPTYNEIIEMGLGNLFKPLS